MRWQNEISSINLQAPEKFQATSTHMRARIWRLDVGVSLELGAWNLELMRVLYLDIFSGISGDMFLGALMDLGVDAHQFEHELEKLRLDGYHLHISRQQKSGIAGVKFDVHLADGHDHEHEHSHSHHEHHHEHGHSHDHVHTGKHEHAHHDK